ncbi:LysM peptidoglycan-binding domain-containing protein [Flagellimonas aequoris]|uniref:LysM peptidoglycan-binding domain-containing protein n=1 Tax=Flagellimonas aequoris TaxID=2306997 RepID=A0A418N734_9FLAO|nr:LysM peptidoglycan-binding domain-containing protein [Allomuricauda aequoris]RIV70497.1 LysM peptidoglycan-binding domain-containing protein [Allomuricauda aequoris]TXK01925.1 LysM peptidoglycan-binding domain-containing protein [Allomuricauda aequoris]
MRNVVAIILFLMSTSLFGQQTDTIGEYFLQPIEVQKDDNLWKLAERHYHDGRQYSKFWTVSKTKGLTNNPDSIYPGMVLYKLAKRTRLPSYHEKKFININTLFQEQNISLDSISEKLNNLKVEMKGLTCCIGNTSDPNKFLEYFISFIIGVASSLFATMIARKIWPEKPLKQVVFTFSFSAIAFLLTFSILDSASGRVGLLGPSASIILATALFLLLIYTAYRFLNSLKKAEEKAEEQSKIPKIHNIHEVVQDFYHSIFDWVQKDKESKGDNWNGRDRLEYWIGFWKMYGEDHLSILVEILTTSSIKVKDKIVEDIIEEIKAVLIKHQRN